MPSRSTNPVYKGDSGDLPLHTAFISCHMHNKVRACRGSTQADGKRSVRIAILGNDIHIYINIHIYTKKPLGLVDSRASLLKKWRPPTLPHCIAVPSAQAGLTSLFGMGRGGTSEQ